MAEKQGDRLRAAIAVVGAGPAGIAAAITAAEAGRQTVLIDMAPSPGGQIWRHRHRQHLPRLARRWLERLDRSGVTVLSGATVIDGRTEAGSGVHFMVDHGGSALAVDVEAAVLATGAHERFLPFPGWTTPGVMGLGGMQALAKSGALVGGLRIVLAGSGPLLLPVAALLAARGGRLAVVAEQAPAPRMVRFAAGLWRRPSRLVQAARYRARFAATAYRWGHWIERIEPQTAGLLVTISNGTRRHAIRCDLAGVGFGLVPSIGLAQLLGCAIRDGCVAVDDAQRTSVPHVFCAGEPTGIAGAEAALAGGRIAGAAAAGIPSPAIAREHGFAGQLERAFALREELRALPEPGTIVCRCEDVPCAALRGTVNGREAKLRTRAGMGPCQGRVCDPMRQFLFGSEPERPRAPLFPTAVGLLRDGAELASSTEGVS